MKNEEKNVNLIFPPWKLMGRFLLVIMLLMVGTGLSGTMLLLEYFDAKPEWLVGTIFSVSIIFCLVNFGVTRGSFLCAKILKYYSLCLIILCVPLLVIVEGGKYYILLSLNFFALTGASYLISGETYQKLVQYQYDFFEDIKEAREVVEKKLAKSRK
ncbi:hypothetical protein [Colwellia sp. E2M01]|uniref:hypothetical protein n=1 Tax=Colwellia sp. E2M01 TaxID=2841561 RepID=UPI001C088764|nr:hypothetical protein [Colwellia sp. E2M01]MBU2869486.1 hypothetical protein [Colwellia sp. E2M01]